MNYCSKFYVYSFQEIYNFLRNYRATPHVSTDKAPADLMFPGRSYRTKIPEVRTIYDDKKIRHKDEYAKMKMKN